MSALSTCLIGEAEAISASASKLSHGQVEAALNLLLVCKNNRSKLVITGVGKSGLVARKIAATFSSIGLMAIYLNPLDALHGDIGVVSDNDLALLLSNSGETEEIIAMIPHLKRKQVKLIALVGCTQSELARQADVILDGSVDKEVCPLNLAPTASTAVAMAIGDALAAVWMERQGISSKEFAINHPGGSLGKQLTLKASDLMIPTKRLSRLDFSTKLPEVISAITVDGIGACWVSKPDDQVHIYGLITDGDLRRALQSNSLKDWEKLTAIDLMTQNPLTVHEDTLAIEALKKMEINSKKPVNILPVVDLENKLLGLLRLHDLIQAGLGSL